MFLGGYLCSGEHLEVASKSGFKDTYKLSIQSCKLQREYWEEKTEDLNFNFAEIALSVFNILYNLAENIESVITNLGATCYFLYSRVLESF